MCNEPNVRAKCNPAELDGSDDYPVDQGFHALEKGSFALMVRVWFKILVHSPMCAFSSPRSDHQARSGPKIKKALILTYLGC